MKNTENILRRRIGILFYFSPKWMGGIIYIQNLIRIVDSLDDNEKPEITLFYRANLSKYVENLKYPYLTKFEWKFPPAYLTYLKSFFLRKNYFVHKIIQSFDFDGLYPVQDFPVKTKTRTKLVSWYADLQHLYYPQFFTKRKIMERNFRIRLMLNNSLDLVVSSKATSEDFSRFFRIPETLKVHVFHFASVIDDFEKLNSHFPKATYGLPDSYFLVSNQFHKHKNHKILFEALGILKNEGRIINLVITGKLPEENSSDYTRSLFDLMRKNELHEQVRFLGIISRKDQLSIMNNAQAVIQPSLFEGWSTVIEDAISLSVPVIASNLPVNIEQLGSEGTFFDPYNPSQLASILSGYPVREKNNSVHEKYLQRIKSAANNFMDVFQ